MRIKQRLMPDCRRCDLSQNQLFFLFDPAGKVQRPDGVCEGIFYPLTHRETVPEQIGIIGLVEADDHELALQDIKDVQE